jgi:hypothetical protein
VALDPGEVRFLRLGRGGRDGGGFRRTELRCFCTCFIGVNAM